MVMEYLPKGQSLPEGVWRVRHKTLSHLLRAHVIGIFVYAVVRGNSLSHSALEAGIVASFSIAASVESRQRKFSSAMTAIGLVTSSAVLVHLSGGLIEMHFHFFVMVGILTLYQDWVPFLLAIGFVVFHHGVFGVLQPGDVYNHPHAVAHPFTWALVHGGFVLAASAASIVAWRLNEEQALRDSLTRLPNRKLFQDRVEHALARSQRHPGNLAVLYLDLDGFKGVNDSLGHAAGDHLLVDFAERLRACLRAADTPARLGGDEFAVLVEDLSAQSDAVAVAERIIQSLVTPFVIRGKERTVGVSIGIAFNTAGLTADEMLRNADVAMYAAKQNGRGHYQEYASEMGLAVVDRIELENGLQTAVANDEMLLHYQPLVSLATGRMIGFEALLRWQHPQHGLLLPGEFIHLAESTGSIVQIGSWVLHTACAQAQSWVERHPDHPITLSVNLSPNQLFQADIVEDVRSALRESHLAPAHLTLELTEGVMLKEGPEAVDKLHALKALGVQLAIDDFGTGYSSLSYLRHLPIDTLKIDKLFVDGIADRDSDLAFAAAICRMAETLHIETVAEGVEHAAQVDQLRLLGCQTAQGYHFAKPLNVDGIDALLSAANGAERWLTAVPPREQTKR